MTGGGGGGALSIIDCILPNIVYYQMYLTYVYRKNKQQHKCIQYTLYIDIIYSIERQIINT